MMQSRWMIELAKHFLFLKDWSKIDFENNICLAAKVTYQWKKFLQLNFNKVKWFNNWNWKYNLMFKLKYFNNIRILLYWNLIVKFTDEVYDAWSML